MHLIAVYAHSTRANALQRLSDGVERRFGFHGLYRSPTGEKVLDAALSRRETQVARLDEQGASKLRIARYLARWLGWVALAGTSLNAWCEVIIGPNITCPPYYFDTQDDPIFPLPGSTRMYFFGVDENDPSACTLIVRRRPQVLTVVPSTGGTVACTPSAPEYDSTTTCTATPTSGFAPNTWGDACVGSGSAASTCTITHVTSAKTVSASFTAIPGYVPTGAVVQIVVDPTTPTTLYAALDGGGVWKKVGAGDWTAATTQPTNLKVKALAIAAGGTTLYAGTDGGGVFKSADSGFSWSACTTQPTTRNIRALALSGSTLYAGTTGGVYASTDSCANWAAMNTGLP